MARDGDTVGHKAPPYRDRARGRCPVALAREGDAVGHQTPPYHDRARGRRHQAAAIIEAANAGAYEVAARWLERAREAEHASGREAEGHAHVEDVLTRHGRKYKLVPLLRVLLSAPDAR